MSETRWNRDIFDRTTDGLALVRDQDWDYTGKLVRQQYDPWRGSSREYMWTDDAACNGVDPKYFTYQDKEDRDYAPERGRYNGGKVRELSVRQSNMIRLLKGQKVCLSCPVAQRCLDEADASDMFYTVRGGYLPAILENPGANKPKRDMSQWLN